MHPALAALGRRLRPRTRLAALGRRVRPRTRLLALARAASPQRLRERRAAAVAARPIDHPSSLAFRRELLGLEFANRFSRRPVVDPGSDVVVTMTTHGDRIGRVHVALESIARGDARPARLVLWLDDPALAADLPRPLRRLRRRGLEVRLVESGYRVHTKYYPHLLSGRAAERDLVTSDDDIVYPRRWLRGLLDARSRYPRETVLCYRAHRVGVVDGAVAPYTSWRPVADTRAGFDVFGTSVSGQLFPRALMEEVARHGDAFREVAPDADDIWLHVRAVDAGYRVAQIEPTAQLFPFVPRTQQTGLYLVNYWDGGNDRQAGAAYTPEVTARIAGDATPDRQDPTA